MCVCVSGHVRTNALSLSDVEAKTTFLPSDLRLFHVLRYFKNFLQHFHPRSRPFFTAAMLTDAQTFLSSYEEPEQRQEGNTLSPKQTGWEVPLGCGARKKNWPDSKGDIAFMYQHLFLFYIFYRQTCLPPTATVKPYQPLESGRWWRCRPLVMMNLRPVKSTSLHSQSRVICRCVKAPYRWIYLLD